MSVTFTTGQFIETTIDGEACTVLAHDDDRDYEVNMSNANAMIVLDRLGYDTEYGLIGSDTAAEFLGRAMTMNVGRHDDGIARSVDKAEGGATWIDMGVRAGYYDERMEQLIAIALMAESHDLMVVWA